MMATLRDLILTYAWNALWQVPLFCAGGWLAATPLRRTGLLLQQRAATATLLLAVIVPGLTWPSSRISALVNVWPWHHADPGKAAIITSLGLGTANPRGLHGISGSLLNVLLLVYLLSCAVAWLRFMKGLWQLRRLALEARPVVLHGPRAELFETIQQRFGVRTACLRESAAVSGPTAFWMGVPMIVLPLRFLEEADLHDLAAALAHECVHLQRQDFFWQLFLTACTLPIAMHPFTAPLRNRVAESREMLCDALSAQALPGEESYAAALLRIAALLPALRPAANLHAIGMLDAHSFERRIMNILRPKTSQTRLGRFGSILAAGVLGTGTCISALALHTSISSERGTAHAQEAASVKPEVVYRKNPVYPAEARAENNTLNGTVTLAVDVNADGKPTSVRVAKSLRTDYDQSAVDAVTEWRFNPATENGRPVAGSTSININYMLAP